MSAAAAFSLCDTISGSRTANSSKAEFSRTQVHFNRLETFPCVNVLTEASQNIDEMCLFQMEQVFVDLEAQIEQLQEWFLQFFDMSGIFTCSMKQLCYPLMSILFCACLCKDSIVVTKR